MLITEIKQDTVGPAQVQMLSISSISCFQEKVFSLLDLPEYQSEDSPC